MSEDNTAIGKLTELVVDGSKRLERLAAKEFDAWEPSEELSLSENLKVFLMTLDGLQTRNRIWLKVEYIRLREETDPKERDLLESVYRRHIAHDDELHEQFLQTCRDRITQVIAEENDPQ